MTAAKKRLPWNKREVNGYVLTYVGPGIRWRSQDGAMFHKPREHASWSVDAPEPDEN